MKLKPPPRVKAGDTIYIVSPSAGLLPFVRNRVDRATKSLSEIGLNVKIARNAAKNAGYISASIDERVEDIHEAFSDRKCSIVMASIGGNHSNQLVSKLNYELIKANPKVFIGYSDNTVLHYALVTQAGLQTYYGPCFLNQFGEYPGILPYTLKYFEDAVFKDKKNINVLPSPRYTDEVLDWFKDLDSKRSRRTMKNTGFEWWRSGNCSGWAMPAAMPSIHHIMPTKYMPNPAGAILMIDIPEGNDMFEGQPVGEVDAWFTDLYNSGLLGKINGIIISRPYKYTNTMVSGLKENILRTTKEYNYPILFNTDFGHTDPMITIPIGSKVVLNSDLPFFTISS